MASVIEVYTIAGGGWFEDVFNGVATFFNSDAADYLLAMGTIISVLVAVLYYINSRNLMDLIKWAAFYVLVVSVLIGIKKDVQVVDLSEPSAIYQIDNVPAGIAVPASLLTRVGAGMAQAYDTIFARPDSLTYTKTGMMFGAALAVGSTNFMFTEPEAQRIFTDYVRNCVVGDIMLNQKYTMGDLMRAEDPYELILNEDTASPLRGLYGTDRNFMTCQEAAKWLKSNSGDLNGKNESSYLAQASSWLHGFTRQVFGSGTDSTALFGTLLGDSYNWFHNTSSTSTEIIRRNVVMNGVRHGLNSYAVDSGNTAGMMSISSEMSLAKMRMSQSTSASVATHTLPIMHTVLLGMTIALFPCLVILAVVSTLSWQILKGYIYTIAYLQMWPILFAILNHAMNFYLKDKLGGTPVVLSTMDQVQNTYSDIGTTAGWLALSIPFIAWGMVKGMGQVMSQAGNYLGQTLQSSATQSSSQTVDGTYAFNNMQTDNVQGNKWDTNYSQRSGHISQQMDSGSMLTRTAGGGTVVDTSGGMSKLATHINWANSTMTGMNTSQREMMAQSQQSMSGYQHSRDSSWSQLQQFAGQHGNSANFAQSGDSGVSGNVTTAMNEMKSLTESYAKANNISESQAYNELMGKSSQGSVSGGVKGTVGTPKWLKAGIGASGEVYAGAEVRGTSDSSHGTRQEHGQTSDNRHDQNAQMVSDFRSARDVVVSNASRTSASYSDGSTASHVEQFAANLQEADREYTSWQTSQTRAHEYSNMATWAQDHRAQIDQNLDQQFANYVMDKAPGRADSILSDTGSASVAAEREALAQSFIQERVLPQLQSTYRENASNLGQGMSDVSGGTAGAASSTYAENAAAIGEKAHQAGVRYDTAERVVAQREHVGQQVSESEGYVDASRGKIEQASATLQKNHTQAQDEQSKGMSNEKSRQTILNMENLKSESFMNESPSLFKDKTEKE